MNSNGKGIRRREFLKRGALAGLGAVLGGSLIKVSYAASRDRVTALSSIGWIRCILTLTAPARSTAFGTT
jgi:hypothetical protein